MGMLAVFLLFTLFSFLVSYVEVFLKLRGKYSFGELAWKMLRFQLVQTENIDFKLVAGEFGYFERNDFFLFLGRCSLLVFSLLQLCIIVGLFQGFILTSVVRVGLFCA